MEKILVNIHIPATGGSFDIFVPHDIPIKELTPIIANGISDLSGGKYYISKHELLCLKDTSSLLNPQYTLQDYGIQDGTHLYMI